MASAKGGQVVECFTNNTPPFELLFPGSITPPNGLAPPSAEAWSKLYERVADTLKPVCSTNSFVVLVVEHEHEFRDRLVNQGE